MRKRNSSSEETRIQLLTAGRALLIERGIPVELKSVSLVDVAKAAGRTTGSAYQLWKTQEDFHRDLSCFALRDTSYADAEVFAAVLLDHLTKGSPLPWLLRDTANAYIDAVSRSREFFVFSHFWAVAIDDPEIRSAMAESYVVSDAINAQLIDVILDAHNLIVVPHLTKAKFAAAVGSLSEGFVLRSKVQPDAVATTITRPEYPEAYRTGWSPYGCALEAMVKAFTLPKPESPA